MPLRGHMILNAAFRRRLVLFVWALAVLGTAGAGATPSYLSYFGLARDIAEAQDHVNLYWAVSWQWDVGEVLDELADARARGLRAIVHTEFALFDGSGPYANACPYTVAADAAARWDSFAQELARRDLLDTVAAFYPVDEPDLCGVAPADVLAVLAIIRAHPLTAGKPVAAIFSCDVAVKFGGPYAGGGGHAYADALRAYDWVGVDCYGVGDMFAEAAWTTQYFDFHCFCVRSNPGPSYYDNFEAQLDLARQRVILVPQGFVSAGSYGPPDDPERFADRAYADPAVILIAPFTWFDQPFYPGVRSQPTLAAHWRRIGRAIARATVPPARRVLLPAVAPRLTVSASDVARFSVFDLDCNRAHANPCAIELDWQAADARAGAQLFVSQDGAAPKLVTCTAAVGYVDVGWIVAGASYRFDLYQMDGCPTAPVSGAAPVATLDVSLRAQRGDQTRRRYSPVRVSISMRSPVATNSGTLTVRSSLIFAGFSTLPDVSPRTAGSVYTTSRTIVLGISTEMALSL
jgi:hypothetical protein